MSTSLRLQCDTAKVARQLLTSRCAPIGPIAADSQPRRDGAQNDDPAALRRPAAACRHAAAGRAPARTRAAAETAPAPAEDPTGGVAETPAAACAGAPATPLRR